ncbi:MAG: DUF2802 domain-containing protein [Pseudomonadota bacterium]
MPEYLAILLVTAGLVVLVAVLMIFTVTRANQRITGQVSRLENKLDTLNERLASIEEACTEHGHDLDALRSEYALHASTRDNNEADYEQAIKAASRGVPFEEVSETYGLRAPEAKLLVAVYGNQ